MLKESATQQEVTRRFGFVRVAYTGCYQRFIKTVKTRHRENPSGSSVLPVRSSTVKEDPWGCNRNVFCVASSWSISIIRLHVNCGSFWCFRRKHDIHSEISSLFTYWCLDNTDAMKNLNRRILDVVRAHAQWLASTCVNDVQAVWTRSAKNRYV